MYTHDRTILRKVYVESWQRELAGLPLEPLQAMIVKIIRQHPEYHALMDDAQEALERDWSPESGESNPFLHMAMHAAVTEQVNTNRPTGIRALHRRLAKQLSDAHEADHQIMECLAMMIWEAQTTNKAVDEVQFMRCIRQRL